MPGLIPRPDEINTTKISLGRPRLLRFDRIYHNLIFGGLPRGSSFSCPGIK
jgi:hypothetical protein